MTTFWVATTGSDTGNGSQSNPFQTIGRAQEAVRAVLDSGPLTQDIVVKIGGGTYQLPQTLTFDAGDSGKDGHLVRYEAVDGETPVISGGRAVTGWTTVDNPGLALAPNTQLWEASVGLGIDTRQLYIDGERAIRSESNHAGTYGQTEYPVAFRPTDDQIPGVSGIEYIVSDLNNANWQDPTTWGNVSDIEAVIYTQWKMASVPLASIAAPSFAIPSLNPLAPDPVGLITLQDPAWTNANLFRGLPSGATTTGSPIIQLEGNFATNGIAFGQSVSGDGIPPGAIVLAVDPILNQILLDQAATTTTPPLATVSLSIVADPSTGELVTQPNEWSMWRVSKFENAYAFLDQPTEWYLDRTTGKLYLVAEAGFDPNTHDIQLPVLEKLIDGNGSAGAPVANLSFKGLSFKYATWLEPNGAEGYVADQSGFHVTGSGHEENIIGHVKDVTRTPGNLSFTYGSNISFTGNSFSNLGAVGLDFTGGAQNNNVAYNVFQDISSAAVQIGGVSAEDARPSTDAGYTRNNNVVGNIIKDVGAEFIDAAGIYVGFAQNTNIESNYIQNVPWSGIALGWGWGLMDQGGFPGLGGATAGMWGPGGVPYTTPTIMQGNRVVGNYITEFLQVAWDGGAVYTTGFQGTTPDNGTEILNNFAFNKRPVGGSNIIYTDGGSRYVTISGNILMGNDQGVIDFGPVFSLADPLNNVNSFALLPLLGNGTAYGGTIGGCITYGDIHYADNIWVDLWQTNPFAPFNPSQFPLNPLYYDICQYIDNGVQYPVALSFDSNTLTSNDLLDSLLIFVRPTAVSISRVDSLGDTVSFGALSLAGGTGGTLLSDASGNSAGALPYDLTDGTNWRASEGQAMGGATSIGQMAAGAWLPMATHDGQALTPLSVASTGNGFLATFEGGYQANYTLGGTRSVLTGDVGDRVVVDVKRLAAFDNGLAFYEADRNSGAVTVDGQTLLPGQAGYLQAALAKALVANLVLDASELPAYSQEALYDNLPLEQAKSYGLLLLVNNSTQNMYSSYAAANPNGAVQILTFGDQDRGVTFGVEDLLVSGGRSDRDYNDLIVTLHYDRDLV